MALHPIVQLLVERGAVGIEQRPDQGLSTGDIAIMLHTSPKVVMRELERLQREDLVLGHEGESGVHCWIAKALPEDQVREALAAYDARPPQG